MNSMPLLVQHFFILLGGMAGGFGSSAPLGVINLWVTDKTLSRCEDKLRPFLSGVIAADLVYAALAFWGYHAYFDEGNEGALLGIFGGLFLIVLGIINLKRKTEGPGQAAKAAPQRALGTAPLRDFALGAFLVLSNPAFLMFWVVAIKFVESRLGQTIDFNGELVFLLGILCGDFLWFWLLIALIRRGRSAFQPRLVERIRWVIAVSFIIFGGLAVAHSAQSLKFAPTGQSLDLP